MTRKSSLSIPLNGLFALTLALTLPLQAGKGGKPPGSGSFSYCASLGGGVLTGDGSGLYIDGDRKVFIGSASGGGFRFDNYTAKNGTPIRTISVEVGVLGDPFYVNIPDDEIDMRFKILSAKGDCTVEPKGLALDSLCAQDSQNCNSCFMGPEGCFPYECLNNVNTCENSFQGKVGLAIGLADGTSMSYGSRTQCQHPIECDGYEPVTVIRTTDCTWEIHGSFACRDAVVADASFVLYLEKIDPSCGPTECNP